jgi:hypothetical protein
MNVLLLTFQYTVVPFNLLAPLDLLLLSGVETLMLL